MHAVSLLSDFLDLFITFTFLLILHFPEAVLSTLQLPRG